MPGDSKDVQSTINVAIDEGSLGGDNGEIYLFQWLASNENALQQASLEDIKANQDTLQTTLISLITTASSPYPSPGRPIRNLVAQCFNAIYSRGETRSLFDTIQSFLKPCSDPKSTLQDTHRVAAIYCVGELMKNFGSQVMSLLADTVTTCLRLFRSGGSPLLRYHAVVTLEKSLVQAKRALTDSLAKDVLRQMRNAMGDKTLSVVRAATRVLILMYPAGDGSRSTSEVESLVALCVKHLDHADQPTRSSFSKLVAHLLATTQIERVTPTADIPKKNKKSDNDEDEDIVTTTPAASSEAPLIMAPTEMFGQLSMHFNKPQSSHKTRVGVFTFYMALLTVLGPQFVEKNYQLIVSHLMNEIVSHPRNSTSRYEVLHVRSLVHVLLRDLIGVRMLSEQYQITAIQELSSAYLKRWPAMMPGQTAPSGLVLVVALREVAGLLQQLGNAPPAVQDVLAEPLVSLLAHPNHTVRVTAAWTLRSFCYSTPLRLPKTLLNLVEMLQQDMASLITPVSPVDIHRRSLGHAYGLTALLALIPQRPLYVSYDINSNVFYMSVQLLKRAGEHDVHIARVEIEIAWTMIASLMALGPNFVRAHLPQLLILWRNALPKPTTKEGNSERSVVEWDFLLRVRESALRAVYHFLLHNPALVTTDIARRIASMLTNALQFANLFISQHVEQPLDPASQGEQKGLTLNGTEALLRYRIFQCFASLDLSSVTEATQTLLLQSAISLFASSDGYSGSSVQAAIASSSGSFVNIWQTFDGYAYGVTDVEVKEDPIESSQGSSKDWLNRDAVEAVISEMKPILRSLEHDPLLLCQPQPTNPNDQWSESPPAATAAVNAAILLFSRLLPLQDTPSVVRSVNLLLDATGSSKLEKNTGRKAAVLANSTVALVLALRQASIRSRQTADGLGSPQTSSSLATFLKGVLVDGDHFTRQVASEAIGRLASVAGTNFLTNQVKTLVNEVVGNRDPNGRAGCALAFGAIYGYVGGLAAGPLLKTTVHVLMSLVNDPHPIVHFWAMRALARVIDAASLAYAPYVPSTLGLLFRIYMSESHELEGGSLNHVNIKGELPAYQAVCQNLDAVVTVVGPDIQDSARTRTLILDLVHQLLREEDEGVCVEAMKCIQHLLMFAPESVEIPKLVMLFRGHISSSKRSLKTASLNALYQLVQKDAFLISRLGGDHLVQELFGLLDDDASVDGVRSIITSWLQQTVVYNPSAWIDICQRIMSHTNASQQSTASAKHGEMVDDEGQSLSLGSTSDSTSNDSRLVARWRTQLFALQCLHKICTQVAQSGRREHVDARLAQKLGASKSTLLVSRVSDLVKIAFTASAANVMEIRLEGLTVLQDIIETFASSPDPDYDDVSFLEQYQAPITAALTPAFSADATPEILAFAVKTCATFVGSGIVKDVGKLGRILRLLTTALQQCEEPGLLHLGEAAELSPNASVMLRIAILSAWAKLQVASSEESYLKDVVSPHKSSLASLWVACLRDYASVKAGTELNDDVSAGTLDSSYTNLGRDTLLPFYNDAWPHLLKAVTEMMEAGEPHIYSALGVQSTKEPKGQPTSTAAMFYVVLGLVFEVLATSVPSTQTSHTEMAGTALRALSCLMEHKVSGDALSDPTIFEELVNLFYRMALTEPLCIQGVLLTAITSFSTSLSADKRASPEAQVPQIHCLRIVAGILQQTADMAKIGSQLISQRVLVINRAFETFVGIIQTCLVSQQLDYQILGFNLYAELLKDEISEESLVEPTLLSLKVLIEQTSTASRNQQRVEQILHALLSTCIINIDDLRGRQGTSCLRKIKNNLLAIVLILTNIQHVKIGEAVIEYCCTQVSQQLINLDQETCLIAAYCCKTLIGSATSGHTSLNICGRLLMPTLLQCVTKIAATTSSHYLYNTHLLVLAEISKLFSSLASISQDDQILAIILPSLILCLNSANPVSLLHKQAVTHILQLAAINPTRFKEGTLLLNNKIKEEMEFSIKHALGDIRPVNIDSVTKPQISLRSF